MTTLAQVEATFRKWVHLPDMGVVRVVLATVVANRLPGEPVWLLVIGPPSGGKTEPLLSLRALPEVCVVATLSEASLLSGTSKRDVAAGAKGGYLREIGEYGILVLKDFGSILSMHRDARAATLAALREVYDGAWTRLLGSDGGKTLAWKGKLGLLAGATEHVDLHHHAMAALGERFISYRLPTVDADRQALRALRHSDEKVLAMRRELAEVVGSFFETLTLRSKAGYTHEEQVRLVSLATLVVRSRSAVERDPYTREVVLIPEPEAPARLSIALARLYNGLCTIGVPEAEVWPLLVKVGLDCIPGLRRKLFEVLREHTDLLSTAELAAQTEYHPLTVHRALDDLRLHGIVEKDATGVGKADYWQLTSWARKRYQLAMGGE